MGGRGPITSPPGHRPRAHALPRVAAPAAVRAPRAEETAAPVTPVVRVIFARAPYRDNVMLGIQGSPSWTFSAGHASHSGPLNPDGSINLNPGGATLTIFGTTYAFAPSPIPDGSTHEYTERFKMRALGFVLDVEGTGANRQIEALQSAGNRPLTPDGLIGADGSETSARIDADHDALTRNFPPQG